LPETGIALNDMTGHRPSCRWNAPIDIVRKAEDGSIVIGKISDNDAYGYDAQEGQYALQDVASIAGLLVTTEAMVAEKPKKETPAMPGMPPGGGMDY
jgi:hypothetical protein